MSSYNTEKHGRWVAQNLVLDYNMKEYKARMAREAWNAAEYEDSNEDWLDVKVDADDVYFRRILVAICWH